MTDYNKSVNFAVKDTLTSGDPNKIVSGAEIDTEFNNLASSSTTKIDKVPAAGTGNLAQFTATGAIADSGKTVNDVVPSGVILMWSGGISSIPSGWSLCDGTNGTPDLRNRFVVGAGSGYSVGDTGGSTSTSEAGAHTHTTNSAGGHNHGGSTAEHALTVDEMPSHSHGVPTADVDGNNSFGELDPATTGSKPDTPTTTVGGGQGHTHGVSIDGAHTHNVLSNGAHQHTVTPPYYALAYIMKL